MNKLKLLGTAICSLFYAAITFTAEAGTINFTGLYSTISDGSSATLSMTFDDSLFVGGDYNYHGAIVAAPALLDLSFEIKEASGAISTVDYDDATIYGGDIRFIITTPLLADGEEYYPFIDVDDVNFFDFTNGIDIYLNGVSPYTVYNDINNDYAGSEHYNLLSFTANSVPSPVPVPAAAWLFGSGLLGLIGVAKRKV